MAGPHDAIKTVLDHAALLSLTVGILPLPRQRNLRQVFDLPNTADEALSRALRNDPLPIDLIRCNGSLMLYRASFGRLPLLDARLDQNRLRMFLDGIRSLLRLSLFEVSVSTAGDRTVLTAAAGCMIIQHHTGRLASRLMPHETSLTNAVVSLVIAAPASILGYLSFLFQALTSPPDRRRPAGATGATGLIRSRRLTIESRTPLDVRIDGSAVTRTPLTVETVPGAVRVNVGPEPREVTPRNDPAPEDVHVKNLPKGKELARATGRSLPFFSYASEERFRSLFTALRDDARVDGTYVMLMILSTLLATIGLYLNSASVVIGAMLLAPLMAPIVSLAMGLLRHDSHLMRHSFVTILVGMTIALAASAVITLLFPHKPLTAEMEGRLNPTLLDLAVAIVSGLAAAYSKSFREVIQSLAGVAIAVALVPPLAVAGVGIGRADFDFFAQAFLLFSTNLIGIVLAAAFMFRVLGYSAAIRSTWGLSIVVFFLALVSIPLYLSYDRIVSELTFERSWQTERFLVNGKYIIVHSADLSRQANRDVVVMELLAREPLTRADLSLFREKVQTHFSRRLVIRARVVYIP